MRRLGHWAGALALVLVLTGCTPGLADSAGSVADPVAPSGTGLPSPGADGAPSPTAEATAAPDAPPVSTAPPIVPEQAPTKTFAVGSRELSLSRGDRPLRTVVWYPAAGPAGGPLATPAAGLFPLVLFSHGLTATPEVYQRVTTRIAAAGFIVAAPAYPYTNGAATTYNPADLINQPADASAVITGVLALNDRAGDALAGHIDGSRIGAAGHSAGGYTTVGMLSGARDPRLRAAIVIAGGSLGGSFTGPALPVLFIHGQTDPIVSYSVGVSTYNLVPWPKALLTITKGDHSSYLFTTGPVGTAVSTSMLDFLRWSLYGDSGAQTRLPGEAAVTGVTTFETSL
jgi:dienelactone hydrolase